MEDPDNKSQNREDIFGADDALFLLFLMAGIITGLVRTGLFGTFFGFAVGAVVYAVWLVVKD